MKFKRPSKRRIGVYILGIFYTVIAAVFLLVVRPFDPALVSFAAMIVWPIISIASQLHRWIQKRQRLKRWKQRALMHAYKAGG